jgi:hypothetical protein
VDVAFSNVWMEFTASTGNMQRTPERHAIGHAHARASSGGTKA